MTGILGYARVSTGDQDVAGQTMRLTQAGAIKVFNYTVFYTSLTDAITRLGRLLLLPLSRAGLLR